jgi:hypothetical protein
MQAVLLEGVIDLSNTPFVRPSLRIASLEELEKLSEWTPEQRAMMAGLFGASGFVDSVEQALLNHYIDDPAYTPVTPQFLSLSSTTPTEAGGNFTEPSGGSYARVSTAAADWAAASGTAPATKATSATKTFPTASADWVSGANLTHFGLHDASSAGNLLAFGALTVAKPVLNGDTASFAAGAIVLKLGDPGDSY